MSMTNHNEAEIIAILDAAVLSARARSHIDPIVATLERTLDENPHDLMAWERVPLFVYGVTFPDEIRSSWIFVLRRYAATGEERHPNSIQRVMSYGGAGDLQTKEHLHDPWLSNVLESGFQLPVHRRWLSIPAGVWHQAVVEGGHWSVISFHTVKPEDLFEERPDPSHMDRIQQKNYVNAPASEPDSS